MAQKFAAENDMSLRRTFRIHLCLAALLAGSASVAAYEASDLYRARTIVTGQTAETRAPGAATCLRDVLVKVSGDPRLLDDPRVAALAQNAVTLADDFEYRDRMAGIQIHDEQGSRDRAFYLTVAFNPDRIDTALDSLGKQPWRGPRPRIAMFLSVKNGDITYALASDSNRGRDQRDSLADAAWQMGMDVSLPDKTLLEGAHLTAATIPDADLARLARLAGPAGGEIALAGRLEWNKGSLGWLAEWRLATKGTNYRWRIRDVNFDDAFRSAMRGGAQILSGNGAPDRSDE